MYMVLFMGEIMKKVLCFLFLTMGCVVHANTHTYVCDYEQYSDSKGLHDVKDQFNITIIYDTDADRSYMVGELGTTDLIPVFNIGGGITFIETTDSGNVITTTINIPTRESVHSRNSLVFGELIPSQYYGKCEIKR